MTNDIQTGHPYFSLRPARETESAQIKALIRLVGINPMDLDWKRFVVAVNEQDQMLGCGQLKPHGTDILELASLAVYPEHQGKGVGRALIEHLLKNSPRPLYLMCVSHNGPMYEKFGFIPVSVDQMPKYFRRMKNVFDVADVFRKSGEELLVMKLG